MRKTTADLSSYLYRPADRGTKSAAAGNYLAHYFHLVGESSNHDHEAHVMMVKAIQEAREKIIYVCFHDAYFLAYPAMYSLEAKIISNWSFADKMVHSGEKNNTDAKKIYLEKFCSALDDLRKSDQKIRSLHSKASIKERAKRDAYLQEGVAIAQRVPIYIEGWEYVVKKIIHQESDTLDQVKMKNTVKDSLMRVLQEYDSHRNNLTAANFRLSISIARKYQNRGLDFEDLIAEGNMGLMKGAERFDYKRGYHFSTYASFWIHHGIQRALADKARNIRLPVHILDNLRKLRKTERKLIARLMRLPTDEEMAQEMEMPLERMRKLYPVRDMEPFSLDAVVSAEDPRMKIEFIEDEDAYAAVSGEATSRQSRQLLLKSLKKLKPIEADILRQRFGLEGRELTLKEIGDQYHLSRERIRQLQDGALKKLRKHLASQGLSSD